MFKKIILASFPLFLVGLLVPAVVFAAGFFEDFSPPIKFKQPGDLQRPGLWLINDGDFHNGSFQYYKHCGDSSCIDGEEEGGIKFLRTAMFHDATSGNYVNMEASELQTGYAYGRGFEDTHPTFGHPVTFEAKVRCSACNFDGTGSQVGSWGLWEWNSYPQANSDGSFTINPTTAIGFGWIQSGGLLPGGLSLEVFRNNNPIYFVPLSLVMAPIDLTQWHVYKFVWSVNPGNLESVSYFIDGNQVGYTNIPTGMPSLSETMWHDNQLVTGVDPNGNFVTSFQNPSVPQTVDVDYITVSQ